MHNKSFAQYTFVSSAGKKAKLHFRNFRLHRKLMMQFRIRAIPFCSKIMLSTNNRQMEADFVKDLYIFYPSRNTCLIEIDLTTTILFVVDHYNIIDELEQKRTHINLTNITTHILPQPPTSSIFVKVHLFTHKLFFRNI